MDCKQGHPWDKAIIVRTFVHSGSDVYKGWLPVAQAHHGPAARRGQQTSFSTSFVLAPARRPTVYDIYARLTCATETARPPGSAVARSRVHCFLHVPRAWQRTLPRCRNVRPPLDN